MSAKEEDDEFDEELEDFVNFMLDCFIENLKKEQSDFYKKAEIKRKNLKKSSKSKKP